MPNYSQNEVILVSYAFTDFTSIKVRPAVVVSASHKSKDLLIVPLTSKTTYLLSGEFVLNEWQKAGLNVESAVKRGIFTVDESLVKKQIGKLETTDAEMLEQSIKGWLNLT